MVPGPPPGPPVLRYVSISQAAWFGPGLHIAELVTGPLAGMALGAKLVEGRVDLDAFPMLRKRVP